MADYSKGIIYKITNDYNNDIYIGSTCDTLGRRYARHKTDFINNSNNCKARKLYKLMDEIGFERFLIKKICDYPCENLFELKHGEGKYICEMGTLNMRIAGRTQKEYQQTTEYKKYHKQYHQKPEYIEYQQQYQK
jgi:hypothetical protein